MKANELRIGNRLNHNDGHNIGAFIVELVHIDDIVRNNEYAKQYEPIPLSEEWLVRFEKINWISKDIGGIFFWFNGEKKYLKFVHSLQNTYFYIEQKELLCENI